MALKSTAKTSPETKENLEYPCLRRARRTESSSGDFVVLFVGPKEGTVVYSGPNSPWELGVHSKYWVDAGTRVDWKPCQVVKIKEA